MLHDFVQSKSILPSDPQELELLAQMLAHYSEPDQKDDNRYCCVLALDLLYPRFKEIATKSLGLYLRLQATLIKLLVDELSEVGSSNKDQKENNFDSL